MLESQMSFGILHCVAYLASSKTSKEHTEFGSGGCWSD